MVFERFDGSSRGNGKSFNERVRVWSSGKIAFNKPAVERWLPGVDHVDVFIEKNTQKPIVGIMPQPDPDQGSYTLQTKGSYDGKLLHAKALLKELRLERPSSSVVIDTTEKNNGMVALNLEPLEG